MIVPPFPSQDLAKLVLGYLMEEQLMTAYDEFLQASPYLDAFSNEYDRILMTSLRNILAEYRAIKIYVETCKPLVVRRKLLQCTNLLEVISFLISNVDVNKVQAQDVGCQKVSFKKHYADKSLWTASGLVTCNCSNLSNCTCRHKHTVQESDVVAQVNPVEDNSLNATQLEDLPGSHVITKRKNVKILDKQTSIAYSNIEKSSGSSVSQLSHLSSEHRLKSTSSSGQNSGLHMILQNTLHDQNLGLPAEVKTSSKTEEFHKVLNNVFSDNNVPQTLSVGTSFQDFSNGVQGSKEIVNVPDSSTTENLTLLVPASKCTTVKKLKMIKKGTKAPQVLFKIDCPNIKKNITNTANKTEDNKVTILSDIRVENSYQNENIPNVYKKPQLLQNATSTPLLQMQTILINGTPVYQPKTPHFTKDEIMSMPTLILMPTSGPPNVPSSNKIKQVTSQSDHSTTTNSVAAALGPITIDITSNSSVNHQETQNVTTKCINMNQKQFSKASLMKTVEFKNASVPKDNVVSTTDKPSTPQVLPLLRKSSSTPRRNSHVRVLDFATPRRILHETLEEKLPDLNCSSPKEVIISKSTNTQLETIGTVNKLSKICFENALDNSKKDIKDSVKKNWDEDLRILASTGLSPCKPKVKSIRTKKSPKDQLGKRTKRRNTDMLNEKKKSKKLSPKSKISKKKQDIIKESKDKSNVSRCNLINSSREQNVNILKENAKTSVCEAELSMNKSNETKVKETKSNINDEHIDTPEAERISLQNVIGAKLNISDFLETPYKQALYDIQMETPRFLGPDLPNEPLSDIKIMNIPTPRFFDTQNLAVTPKLVQATPSSFSSRPTDYSSGGSYYKPDDHDCMPVPDLQPIPKSTVSKESPSRQNMLSQSKELKSKEKVKRRSNRPVRQCTKNVSYRSNKSYVRNKSTEDKLQSNSDSESNSEDLPITEIILVKPQKTQRKLDTKKKNYIKVTPVKKDSHKSFMKIKPRRPTPIKTGRKKKISPNISTKIQVYNDTKESIMTSSVELMPVKSRRKSSTPRKINCHKPNNLNSCIVKPNQDTINNINSHKVRTFDSDNDQVYLHWSDDGSQEYKNKNKDTASPSNSTDDISKIKEFIEMSKLEKTDCEGSLHVDLVKRGFDVETAKIIERDLLDTPPYPSQEIKTKTIDIPGTKTDKDVTVEKSIESDCSTVLQIQEEQPEYIDEVELSVHECNEESSNYVSFKYVDKNRTPNLEESKIKDTFCMEVCIEDGISVRLKPSSFCLLFDKVSDDTESLNEIYDDTETEAAVNSISNFGRLYTPLKNAVKAQCYEIFDSTLTSLDTPLKVDTPITPLAKERGTTVPEIVLEVQQIVEKQIIVEKTDDKKRKRSLSTNGSEDSSECKKTKSDTQYLPHSPTIQNLNFDIETVLTKLHGP